MVMVRLARAKLECHFDGHGFLNACAATLDTAPRRFISIRLTYHLEGPEEEHESRIQRALELSRDKYCSVLHSLDPGIEIDLRVVPS